MRVGCGSLFLLIAAFCGWSAFNWSHNASQSSGFVDWVTDAKATSENSAVKFGVGAAIFGVLGLLIFASGGGQRTQQPPASQRPPAPQPTQSRPSPPRPAPISPTATVEQRLKKLHDLRMKGLITEDEYARRRQAILDEV